MGVKRVIPGILVIASIIILVVGVYASAADNVLNHVDCEKCHNGDTPLHTAKEAHMTAGTSSQCDSCHESSEESHTSLDMTLKDCASCHDNDLGEPMVDTDCTVCHVSANPPSESRSDCDVCHSNWFPDRAPERSVVPHTGTEDCTQCHPGHIEVGEHNDMCVDCHPATVAKFQTSSGKHYTRCDVCHIQHGDVPECTDCHGLHHGVELAQCSKCHDAHAAGYVILGVI